MTAKERKEQWFKVRGTEIDEWAKAHRGEEGIREFKRVPTQHTNYIKWLLSLQMIGIGTIKEIWEYAANFLNFGDEYLNPPTTLGYVIKSLCGAGWVKIAEDKFPMYNRQYEITEAGEKVISFAMANV